MFNAFTPSGSKAFTKLSQIEKSVNAFFEASEWLEKNEVNKLFMDFLNKSVRANLIGEAGLSGEEFIKS